MVKIQYEQYGVNLSPEQAKKIVSAHKKGIGTTIKLTKNNLEGDHKLALTQTQIKSKMRLVGLH